MHNSKKPLHTKEEVRKKYNASSLEENEYEKSIWGSHEGMINRYKLGMELIEWEKIGSWLDIGCGPGTFFTFAEQEKAFDFIAGCDISESMLFFAKSKVFRSPSLLLQADCVHLPFHNGTFDLVTLIGVLQDCGSTSKKVFAPAARVLKKNGQLLLTTKNIEWDMFTNKTLEPFPEHDWFSTFKIKEDLEESGIKVVDCYGLLTREGRLVSTNESHTIIVRGIKE